jgi:hypothetical protein
VGGGQTKLPASNEKDYKNPSSQKPVLPLRFTPHTFKHMCKPMNYIGSLICSLIIIIISSSSSISAASILLHVNHATRTIIEAVFIVLRTKELTHTTTTV